MNKNILLCLFVLSSCLPGSICGATTIIENFDSYSNGTTASVAGWTSGFGSGLADWAVKAPPTSGDSSAASFARIDPNTGDGMVYKAFDTSNGFTSSDTIYYSAWVRPQATGSAARRTSFGIVPTGSTTAKELFGISDSGGSATTFKLFVANSTNILSTASFDMNDWYELQLVIDQSAGPTNAVGSLFVRDVTDGETGFTAVDGLQNINLGLNSAYQVTNWGNWSVRSAARQEIDNLSLSTTAAVPEPSTVTILMAGMVLIAVIRRGNSSGSVGRSIKIA